MVEVVGPPRTRGRGRGGRRGRGRGRGARRGRGRRSYMDDNSESDADEPEPLPPAEHGAPVSAIPKILVENIFGWRWPLSEQEKEQER